MTNPSDCKQNKLIREGTSQDQRYPDALNPDKPDYPRIDERKPEHAMVFARAYSKYLQFYGSNNTVTGNWEAFFSQDVSVQLAVAAVQDVDYYKSNIKVSFDFLNDRSHKDKESELKQHLGYLLSTIGTLAKQLDSLKNGLPDEIALKNTLQNLIRNQLAPAFGRLIAYYKADQMSPDSARLIADDLPDIVLSRNRLLLGETTAIFSDIYSHNFSKDWITNNAADWKAYIANISADSSVYGSDPTVFERINHIATHNLFTGIFDQFLKVFARTVIEAKAELEKTFSNWDNHEPHYALFLSFLKLFDHARTEANTLTQKHLDFYYTEVLKLKKKSAEPSQAHLLVELAKQAGTHEFKKGDLFKAGKDGLGIEAFFANDQDFIANQAKVTGLKTLYRHKNIPNETLEFQDNRLFASPVADSADGKGAKLTTVDQSWHPFFNKTYKDDSKLGNINMPKAEVGFAIASHYLWMADGERTITIDFKVTGTATALTSDRKEEIICLVTTEKGWFEIPAKKPNTESGILKFITESELLKLEIKLSGADPAVTPYSPKTHSDYNFSTNLPVLLVKLRHQDNPYLYPLLQDSVIEKIDLTIDVTGLKSLAVSNDFGPVDTSKPFQPFGASPKANSALVIGSKEAFQKTLSSAKVNIQWQTSPAPFPGVTCDIDIGYLQSGKWEPSKRMPNNNKDIKVAFPADISVVKDSTVDEPDFSEPEFYSSASRRGFVRLTITNDFGQSLYEQALIGYIRELTDSDKVLIGHNSKAAEYPASKDQNSVNKPDYSMSVESIKGKASGVEQFHEPTINENKKPTPPVGPFATELTLDYTTAGQTITLNSIDQSAFEKRKARFFHIFPFGHAEQHPYLKAVIPVNETNIADRKIYLLPQLKHLNTTDNKLSKGVAVTHEAEFYIGITGLKPPQNLALFFQVADGTANPEVTKPDPHIHWSYLCNNEWLGFDKYDVQDTTGGLINSGIITFAMPDQASSTNTLLPAGQHWLRAAVSEKSDAVCRLLKVSAQGLKVTFQNRDNDPTYPAKTLPAGTISKLDQADAEVKQITQPFLCFGGRGAEQDNAFYTRISERLRHKDRAIALWDYERLILEAFPQIYKVKCLNHTFYDKEEGAATNTYKELAPGHVTIITIPNQEFHNLRDPLRPFTSLGLLEDIKAFLKKRLSCFVIPHVKNPEFEEVGTHFKVRFLDGCDETFYKNKLQEAITRFLSPWAFPGGGKPTFGGKIYQSVLINFIEEQPYVDYVIDFKFTKRDDATGPLKDVADIENIEIKASKAISILVSAKAKDHLIDPITPSQDETSGKTCPCAT